MGHGDLGDHVADPLECVHLVHASIAAAMMANATSGSSGQRIMYSGRLTQPRQTSFQPMVSLEVLLQMWQASWGYRLSQTWDTLVVLSHLLIHLWLFWGTVGLVMYLWLKVQASKQKAL